MRHSTTIYIALAVAVAASSGCNGGMTDGSSAALEEDVTAIEQSTIDHGARVRAAETLDEIVREEASYADVMRRHRMHADDDMTDMRRCGMMSGDMMGDDGERFDGLMNEMSGMCSDHRAAMDAMTTMDDALAEEARHQGAMADLIDRSESDVEGMDGGCH